MDALTPTERLRALLEEQDKALAELHFQRDAGLARAILERMDQIDELFASLERKGLDLRAERSYRQTIEGLLHSKAALIVRALGGVEVLREEVRPSPDRWWWYLDEELKRRRIANLRRVAIGVLIALGVLGAFMLVYNRFLKPDEVVSQAYDLTAEGEQFVEEGEYAEALARYEQAVAIYPKDADAWVWVGVLRALQGDERGAEEAWSEAERLWNGDRVRLFTTRSLAWVRVGDLDRAFEDAQMAHELDPNSPEAYLALGNVYEARGEFLKALDAFQQGSRLSEEQGKEALHVILASRAAVLMQSMPALHLTPTP